MSTGLVSGLHQNAGDSSDGQTDDANGSNIVTPETSSTKQTTRVNTVTDASENFAHLADLQAETNTVKKTCTALEQKLVATIQERDTLLIDLEKTTQSRDATQQDLATPQLKLDASTKLQQETEASLATVSSNLRQQTLKTAAIAENQKAVQAKLNATALERDGLFEDLKVTISRETKLYRSVTALKAENSKLKAGLTFSAPLDADCSYSIPLSEHVQAGALENAAVMENQQDMQAKMEASQAQLQEFVQECNKIEKMLVETQNKLEASTSEITALKAENSKLKAGSATFTPSDAEAGNSSLPTGHEAQIQVRDDKIVALEAQVQDYNNYIGGLCGHFENERVRLIKQLDEALAHNEQLLKENADEAPESASFNPHADILAAQETKDVKSDKLHTPSPKAPTCPLVSSLNVSAPAFVPSLKTFPQIEPEEKPESPPKTVSNTPQKPMGHLDSQHSKQSPEPAEWTDKSEPEWNSALDIPMPPPPMTGTEAKFVGMKSSKYANPSVNTRAAPEPWKTKGNAERMGDNHKHGPKKGEACPKNDNFANKKLQVEKKGSDPDAVSAHLSKAPNVSEGATAPKKPVDISKVSPRCADEAYQDQPIVLASASMNGSMSPKNNQNKAHHGSVSAQANTGSPPSGPSNSRSHNNRRTNNDRRNDNSRWNDFNGHSRPRAPQQRTGGLQGSQYAAPARCSDARRRPASNSAENQAFIARSKPGLFKRAEPRRPKPNPKNNGLGSAESRHG